jgi:GT2 family glycosyltransferase
MTRANPRIDAVVVTRDRLPKLQACIAALRAQVEAPGRILVVDNQSGDGTRDWLRNQAARDPQIVCEFLEANTGGAGGFHAGIRRAYRDGADWVWVMDDDVVPASDCLAALIRSPYFRQHAAGTRTIGFLSSRVEWIDGTVCLMNIPVGRWPWNGAFHEMDSSLPVVSNSFVSCLISREGIARVGLPVKEFFIWADDTEYTRRLSWHFECFYVDASRAVHDTPANMLPTYSQVTPDNLWKYLCDIRNTAAFEASVGRRLDRLIALRYVATNTREAWRATRDPVLAARLALSGLRGMFWNYKKLIEHA